MILTDREIQIALETKQIIVDPSTSPSAFSSTTLDLTLSVDALIFRGTTSGLHTQVDPAAEGFTSTEVLKQITEQIKIPGTGFQLEPKAFLLMWTAEFINLPITSRIAARVEGKSSLARLGVGVHVTAPTIHAGFSGQVQLEVFNHGPLPVLLRPGMRVCQLVFEQTLGVAQKGYSGQFVGQGTR